MATSTTLLVTSGQDAPLRWPISQYSARRMLSPLWSNRNETTAPRNVCIATPASNSVATGVRPFRVAMR